MLTANFQGDGGHINGEVDFEIDIYTATQTKEPQVRIFNSDKKTYEISLSLNKPPRPDKILKIPVRMCWR